MSIISLFYILNATLLLLHEIESAFEKEWKILKLPGKITGFLILHVPIIILLFYGLLEIEKQTRTGFIIGIIVGISGSVPFLVHKVLIKRENHFNLFISNIIICLNIPVGITVSLLSISALV
jgi:hypothetical protein